jgi:hypothetical protein
MDLNISLEEEGNGHGGFDLNVPILADENNNGNPSFLIVLSFCIWFDFISFLISSFSFSS